MAVESFALGGAVAFFGFLLALLVIRAPSSSGASGGTTQVEASPSGNGAVLALFMLLFLVILAYLLKTV